MSPYKRDTVLARFYNGVIAIRYRMPRLRLGPLMSPPPVEEGAPRLSARAPSVDIDFPRERPAICIFSGVMISPGSRPSAGLRLPRSRPIRPGGMGPCASSLRFMNRVDVPRECNLGGGGIREEEVSPGEVPAGVSARDARGPEPEDEVDGRDTFDSVAPTVNGALEESKKDLAVVGVIGGKGYSYGPEASVL